MSHLELAAGLFLQLAVIVVTCRLAGWLGRRFFGQTQVVMEMVAGVLLGPSLFGMLAPEAQEWLFPRTLELADGSTMAHPAMSILFALSQVGLVLYMFVMGLEFDARLVLGRLRSAAAVSGAGILVPLALGAGAAVFLHDDPVLFPSHVSAGAAALFLGAAMSITAFPMLARILHEKGISRTSMGTLALAAGSSDDAIAWCLLAVVLAYLQGSAAVAALAIGGGVFYAVLVLTAGRGLFRWLARSVESTGHLAPSTLAATLAVLSLAAWFTDAVGIYAVFGAFLCGIAVPRGPMADALIHKLEDLVTVFLLPVFFVFSGLNTRIDLVDSPALWGLAIAMVVVAILGKGVACTLAARLGGEPWRAALGIGVLMNARGLMELILLNLGLQHGVITPTLFTIMVFMAIVTTLMASPLFDLLQRRPPAPRSGPGRPEPRELVGRSAR